MVGIAHPTITTEVSPSVEIILNMRLLYAFALAIFIIISIILTWLYRLNDQRMLEISLFKSICG